MNSEYFSVEQITWLSGHAARELRRLDRICKRFDELGLLPSDPVRGAAWSARKAMHGLLVVSRYAGMKHGVGQPGRDQNGA